MSWGHSIITNWVNDINRRDGQACLCSLWRIPLPFKESCQPQLFFDGKKVVLEVALRRIGSIKGANRFLFLKHGYPVVKSLSELCNKFSQSLWFLPRSFQQMIDNRICSYKRGRFQSWEREPIKWQDECRRKAVRPHRSGKLGFALSHWHRAPILGLGALFSLKVGASQAFFFFFRLSWHRGSKLLQLEPNQTTCPFC